jgi:hypothetical protein
MNQLDLLLDAPDIVGRYVFGNGWEDNAALHIGLARADVRAYACNRWWFNQRERRRLGKGLRLLGLRAVYHEPARIGSGLGKGMKLLATYVPLRRGHATP